MACDCHLKSVSRILERNIRRTDMGLHMRKYMCSWVFFSVVFYLIIKLLPSRDFNVCKWHLNTIAVPGASARLTKECAVY